MITAAEGDTEAIFVGTAVSLEEDDSFSGDINSSLRLCPNLAGLAIIKRNPGTRGHCLSLRSPLGLRIE